MVKGKKQSRSIAGIKSGRFLQWSAVILVEPENPDNIGAVARAMKNMGFEDLRLVRPPEAWRARARKMAMSAQDILQKASVFQTFKAAIAERTFVVGTTRRQGPRRGAFLPFFQILERIRNMNSGERVALVFGKESKGLDNKTLGLCDWVTTLPTHSAYPSMNVAQAVTVVLFSLFAFQTNLREAQLSAAKTDSYLSSDQVHEALERFRAALGALGFQSKGSNKLGRIVSTLYGLIKRSRLLEREAQMLRGLSRRIIERSNPEV